jgi:transcriptional regulator with PAS, ATPase and Fis domain
MTGRGRDPETDERGPDELPDLSGPELDPDGVGLTEALDPTTADHVTVRRFTLRVVEGPDAGALSTSAGERMSIGTHPRAHFCLNDRTMSRFHCEIELHRGRALVRDLGSRNGTRVDGVLVQAAYLRRGALLTLGRNVVCFELADDRVSIPLHESPQLGLLAGRSPAMRAAFAVLARAAESDITVLLRGETGTGKDQAAESLHRLSPRRDHPFVVVDCGGLPASLLESELFGHARGAFTGADRARTGAAEAAHRGTLFLDEIGELDLALQPVLLRLLERREVQRIGETRPVPVDVRVIAATSRNLRREVNAGRFRSDLYYRLAVMEVVLPPLRERLEDLPLLVDSLIERGGAGDHPAVASLRTPEFLARLARHDWPGNVRELRNYLESCLALAERAPPPGGGAEPGRAAMPAIDPSLPFRTARERWLRWFERRYLEELLDRAGDNVSAAARAAGVDRVYFHRLLRRVGLR